MRLRGQQAGKHDPQQKDSVPRLRVGESPKLRSTDALTGLLDRPETMGQLDSLLSGGSVTIARFDVNGLNRLCHDLGHTVADMMLRRIALVLAQHASPTDVLGRIGGDDFILARAGADGDAVERLSGEVIQSLSSHLFVDLVRSEQSEPAAEVEVVLSAGTTIVESHPELAGALSRLNGQITEQNANTSASSVLTLDYAAHQRLCSLPPDERLGSNWRSPTPQTRPE